MQTFMLKMHWRSKLFCRAYLYIEILLFSHVKYFFECAIQLCKEGWVQNKTDLSIKDKKKITKLSLLVPCNCCQTASWSCIHGLIAIFFVDDWYVRLFLNMRIWFLIHSYLAVWTRSHTHNWGYQVWNLKLWSEYFDVTFIT